MKEKDQQRKTHQAGMEVSKEILLVEEQKDTDCKGLIKTAETQKDIKLQQLDQHLQHRQVDVPDGSQNLLKKTPNQTTKTPCETREQGPQESMW